MTLDATAGALPDPQLRSYNKISRFKGKKLNCSYARFSMSWKIAVLAFEMP
jgi:hypothetical protein